MSPGPKSVNVTVAPACGFTRPLTIAVSVSVPAPSVTFGDAVVAIVADAGATTVDSFAALHAPETGALFASPLYAARHRYVPACVGVNAGEDTGPPATG